MAIGDFREKQMGNALCSERKSILGDGPLTYCCQSLGIVWRKKAMNRKRIRNGLLVGLLPAALEATLILLVEPTVDKWVLASAILAWYGFGFIVALIEKGNRVVLNSIWITLVLNLPWYIVESVGKNQPDHFAPLVVASLVMGTIIGFACKLVEKRTSSAA